MKILKYQDDGEDPPPLNPVEKKAELEFLKSLWGLGTKEE
jgi:hypothetical protein